MITTLNTAQDIKYLNAAGALTAAEDQDIVWADYLNDPQVGAPKAWEKDLLPAARLLIQDWNDSDREYRRKVNVDDYARALRSTYNRRLATIVGMSKRQVSSYVSPSFVGAGMNYYQWEYGPWLDFAYEVAETCEDTLTVYKEALERTFAAGDYQLDESVCQPVWVQQEYKIGIPGAGDDESVRPGSRLARFALENMKGLSE